MGKAAARAGRRSSGPMRPPSRRWTSTWCGATTAAGPAPCGSPSRRAATCESPACRLCIILRTPDGKQLRPQGHLALSTCWDPDCDTVCRDRLPSC